MNDAHMSAGILVAVLAQFGYPAMPAPFVTTRPRPAARYRRLARAQAANRGEFEGSYLASLVLRLPSMPDVGRVNTAAIAEYCKLSDRVLEDRRLDAAEAGLLAEVAAERGLSDYDVRVVYAAYYSDLHRVALADGVITRAERADLDAVAKMLRLDPQCADEEDPAPRPPTSSKALLEGTTICFTGEMQQSRSECAAAAEAAGMVVQGGVPRSSTSS